MPGEPYLAVAIVVGFGLLGFWLSAPERRGLQDGITESHALEVTPQSTFGVKPPVKLGPKARAVLVPPVVGSVDRKVEREVDRLVRAQNELAKQINDSLDGFLYINDLLDQVLAFASLPVDQRVDLAYEDEDAVAFKLVGTPEGTSGHFLVGRKSFDRDGRELRFLQMEIAMGANEAPVFFRDSLRRGPRLHMTVDYDSDGAPNAMALILQRDIDLKESRKQGIDAFSGTYTTGAGYRVNLVGRESCFSETFGLVNGRISHREKFNGISPLAGDTKIDDEKLKALFEALMKSRLVVSGSLDESK